MSTVLSYAFNNVNKKKFIEATATDARTAVEKLLKNTLHISFNQFITIVRNAFIRILKLLVPSRPIFIYIDTDQGEDFRYKSNYWLYIYLTRFAPDTTFILISSLDDARVINNDIVLLIDDCIYSGDQMSRSVARLSNKMRKHVQLILFVPYMSIKGLESVRAAHKHNTDLHNIELKTIKHTIIYPISSFMNQREAATMFNYYSTLDNPVDISKELQKYAVYFDHKVGDNVSSFPLFYSGLVPNQKNKKFLNRISPLLYQLQQAEKVYKKQITRENEVRYVSLIYKIYSFREYMDLYPLLQNCEHEIKIPDFFNSSCPKPPYKEDYQQYLQLAKHIPKRYNSFSIPKTQAAGKARNTKKPRRKGHKFAKSVCAFNKL